MTLTEKQSDNLFLCGLLGYPCDKCINILDIGEQGKIGFQMLFYQENSDIWRCYRRGADKFELIAGKKLYESFVNNGDMKAYEQLKKLRDSEQQEYAKQKRIFDRKQGKK